MKRVIYFDFLNVVACLAVVGMHVNSAFWTFRPDAAWVLNCFIEKSLVWAVPIFFMLTGATLIRSVRDFDLRSYSRRRIGKTLFPFLFWSGGGLLFDVYVMRSVPANLSIIDYINLVLTSSIPTTSVFWFFLPLFSIYMCLPLFICVEDGKKVSVFRFLSVSYIIVSSMSLLLARIGITLPNDFRLFVMEGWLFYPIAGYVLSRINFNRGCRYALYAAGLIGYTLSIFGTVEASFSQGALVNRFSTLLTPPYLFVPISLFVFVKQLSMSKASFFDNNAGLLKRVAGLTFGVYLIHKFVLNGFLGLVKIDTASIWWPFVGLILVALLSFSVVAIIKKIPFIRKTVG